jgi:hypothetical protein
MALVLAAAIVISLPLALAARAAGSVVFDPGSVSRILSDNLIDSGLLRQVVIQGLFSRETDGQQTASEVGRLMTYASAQERQAAADIVVPPRWAQAQLQGLIMGFNAWLTSDETLPNVSVDLSPIRENLLHGGAADLADLIWSTWPDCTPDQVAQIAGALLSTQSPPFIACRPPEPTGELVHQLMISGLEAEVRTMPESLPLVDLSSPGLLSDLQQTKSLLVSVRLLATWLWLVPASLLGLIVALVVRSWRALFRWWGIPLLAGGLVGIALAALGATLGSRWLDFQLASMAGSVPAALQGAISGIATQGYQAAVRALFRQALVAAGGAGIITLIGVLRGPGDGGVRPAAPTPARGDEQVEPSLGNDAEPPSGMFG